MARVYSFSSYAARSPSCFYRCQISFSSLLPFSLRSRTHRRRLRRSHSGFSAAKPVNFVRRCALASIDKSLLPLFVEQPGSAIAVQPIIQKVAPLLPPYDLCFSSPSPSLSSSTATLSASCRCPCLGPITCCCSGPFKAIAASRCRRPYQLQSASVK